MDDKAKWAWRVGFAPQIPVFPNLAFLLTALQANDAKIIQGATTSPPPLQIVHDWPVEASDLLGYTLWCGEVGYKVGEVEEHFAKLCFQCDQACGEPAYCRHFLNWYDENPREQVWAEMILEVKLAMFRHGPTEHHVSLQQSPEYKAWTAGAMPDDIFADWLEEHGITELAQALR